MGLSLSVLAAAIGVAQFTRQIVALQWIFAFVIFAIFLLVSLYISTTKYSGRDSLFRRVAAPEAGYRERQPLLNEDA